MKIACILITHLRAKVELRRLPHLGDRAVLIVDRSRAGPWAPTTSPPLPTWLPE